VAGANCPFWTREWPPTAPHGAPPTTSHGRDIGHAKASMIVLEPKSCSEVLGTVETSHAARVCMTCRGLGARGSCALDIRTFTVPYSTEKHKLIVKDFNDNLSFRLLSLPRNEIRASGRIDDTMAVNLTHPKALNPFLKSKSWWRCPLARGSGQCIQALQPVPPFCPC
jgi:hypothetical protein